MAPYQAVFFDFGGTLSFDHPPISEGIARICRNMGLEVKCEDVDKARGVAHQNGPRTRDYPTLERMEVYFQKHYQVMLEALGVQGDLEGYARRIRQELRYYSGLYLYPEVEGVLRALKDNGYIVGIISNISCRLDFLCRTLRIDGYLDFAIASDVFGAAKPDPRIFEEGLRRAGVNATQAMHVGDSYEADVVGARGVGISPVLIDREDRYDNMDCKKINNLRPLLAILGIERHTTSS